MSQYNFFIRKVHSLLGVIPVGVFIFVHFLLNSSALGGVDQYEGIVNMMKNPSTSVYVLLLEICVIAIPLLIHAIYGLYIVLLAKNNAGQYSYYRNWAFYLQRITGVIIFIFLIWHVYSLRLAQHEASLVIDAVQGQVGNTFTFIFFALGVVSAAFHLGNGIATFLMSWGITIGPRSQDVLTVVSLAIFVALSVFGVSILFGLMPDAQTTALLTRGGM